MQYERKKPSIAISLLALFLVLVEFVLIFILGGIITIRNISAKTVIDSVLTIFKFDGVSLDDIRKGNKNNDELAELISKEFEKQFDYEMSQQQTAMFLEKSDLSGFLSEYITELTDYLENDGTIPLIEIDDYIQTVEDNEGVISEIIGRPVEETDYSRIKDNLKSTISDYNENITEYNKGISEIRDYKDKIMSVYVIVVLYVLITALLAVMILIYFKNKSGIYRGFRNCAIPFVVVGLGYICVRKLIVAIIRENSNADNIGNFLADAVYKILACLAISGRILIISGAVMGTIALVLHLRYIDKCHENIDY